jgi:hypothetical protein
MKRFTPLEIVAQRVRHRLRHHNRTREVQNGVDPETGRQALDQSFVAHVPDDQPGRLGQRPAEPRAEIVQNNDVLARVHKLIDHMAANVAGAPRYENAHSSLQYPPMLRVCVRSRSRKPDQRSRKAWLN